MNWLAKSWLAQADVRIERRIEFDNLPQNWAAVAMIALVIGACYWIVRTYRAEARAGATPFGRLCLAALRCVVVLLLATIWLEPVIAPYFFQHIEAHTLVMVDSSASMDIEDLYRDEAARGHAENLLAGAQGADPVPWSRARIANRVLRADESSFLRALAGRNQVELVGFGDATVKMASLPATRALADTTLPEVELTTPSGGTFSDLGQSLREMVDQLAGAPISSVVVISDGGINHGEAVEVLGDFARSLEFPIHTLGVGDPSEPRNARIQQLTSPQSAFIGDPFQVALQLEAPALDGEALTVEITEQPPDGSTRLIATRSVAVGAEGAVEPIEIEHRQDRPGRYTYTARVVPHRDETVLQDNSAATVTSVLENKTRVLLVSGGPGWTYRLCSRLLERDSTIEVSCWLQSADRQSVRDGNVVIDHLPVTPVELFEYDVVLLLDPDGQRFPDGWAELLDRHVARNGAGLIYVSGRKQTPRFFRAINARKIVDLLPVVPDPEADLILNQIGYYQKNSAPVEFDPASWSHPVFTGGSEAVAPETWQQIVRVYWHYPVKHEKPAATVLLRHGHPRMRNSFGGHVLLATQFVGSGRSAFAGFDGSWRWRRYGETLFSNYWIQLVRHVAEGRLTGAGGRGRIQTDRDRYSVGQSVVLTARLSDASYRPLIESDVIVEVSGQGAEAVQLRLQRDLNRAGWYRGQYVAQATGDLAFSIKLDSSGEEPLLVTHKVSVQASDVEFRRPRRDTAQLTTLSQRSSNGRFFEVDQAAALADLIPDCHETRVRRGTPEPLWDSAWVMLALITLLTVEWSLRKAWQML